MEQIVKEKNEETLRRWTIAIDDENFDCIRNLTLIETRADHFLAALENRKVSTNVYLRRIHNYALDMDWLLKPVIPKRQWPKVRHKSKRAITKEEHVRIVEREKNSEKRAFYELCWHLGGSQGDVAKLTTEDTRTGGRIRSFRDPGQLSGATFVTAAHKIVTWDKGGIVRLWNPSPKGDFHQLTHNGEIEGAEFFGDGSNILAWSADGSGGIWSLDNSQPFLTFKSREPISGMVLNPIKREFFSYNSEGTIRMWRPPFDESLWNFDLPGGVGGISLTADNSYLLAWNRNGLGMIWSLLDGHKIYEFREFEMVGAKFAPSGSNFLTWSATGNVSVYSLSVNKFSRPW